MTDAICKQCAAPVHGLVCEYCGALTQLTSDTAGEKQALFEYHNILLNHEPPRQAQMLRNGFLPDHAAVLIEAGTRCVPLIDMSNPSADEVQAAARRLRAITIKLRVLPQNDQIQQAVKELEAVLTDYKAADKRSTMALVGCLIFLIVLCALTAAAVLINL